MTIITFFIVISFLIFVHELGHFLAAKKSGVRVDEFSIGFPPRVWSFRRGETLYSLNLIPFGGYVKIFGENPDNDSLSGPDKERSFINKKRHLQAFILVAGVLMNILTAWILLSASYTFGLYKTSAQKNEGLSVIVTGVIKDSPAYNAGLQQGDFLVSVYQEKEVPDSIPFDISHIRESIQKSQGNDIVVTYKRNDTLGSTTLKARQENGTYIIGVSMADISQTKLPFYKAVFVGALTTYDLFKQTTVGTLDFFGNALTFRANLKDVSGPVGIAGYLNEARELGFSTLLTFVAMISINLAVINLLPFPALDGGRLLVVLIESLVRKPIKPSIINTINVLGFMFLMGLMLAVTVSDILKLF